MIVILGAAEKYEVPKYEMTPGYKEEEYKPSTEYKKEEQKPKEEEYKPSTEYKWMMPHNFFADSKHPI